MKNSKKVTRKASKVVKLKSKANEAWKKDTRSISAIHKYLQNEGAEYLEQFLTEKGSNLTVNKITKSKLIANLSDNERYCKVKRGNELVIDTSKKRVLFSLYTIYNVIGRIVKENK